MAVEAGNIMKWLRELARVLAKANRGMVWTTPTGFRVVHETREPKTQRIATSDRTLIVYQEDETRKIDSRKQADGIVALNRLGIAEQTQRKSMFHGGNRVHGKCC